MFSIVLGTYDIITLQISYFFAYRPIFDDTLSMKLSSCISRTYLQSRGHSVHPLYGVAQNCLCQVGLRPEII